MERNKPNLKQRVALMGIRAIQRQTTRKAKKEMEKLSQKHEIFITEIQKRCGEVISLEPQNKQGSIVATLCAHIIQGFDTKEEMDMVTEMIKTAINEYWKRNDIPQKEK